jgi:hypothetical protein
MKEASIWNDIAMTYIMLLLRNLSGRYIWERGLVC